MTETGISRKNSQIKNQTWLSCKVKYWLYSIESWSCELKIIKSSVYRLIAYEIESYMLPLTDYTWEIQNDALWDIIFLSWTAACWNNTLSYASMVLKFIIVGSKVEAARSSCQVSVYKLFIVFVLNRVCLEIHKLLMMILLRLSDSQCSACLSAMERMFDKFSWLSFSEPSKVLVFFSI